MLFHFHSLPCAYKHPYNLYRIFSSANSHLPIPSLLVHKIILLIDSDNSFFYTSALLHLPNFCLQESLQSTPENIFSTSAIKPIQAASRDQWARKSCEEWHCFTLCLLPQIIGRDNRAHNHRFLIACLSWRCLKSESKAIRSTFSHILNLLSLFLYPTNTITKFHKRCLTWFSF